MSRTTRNKRPKMKLGTHLGYKQYKNKSVRDGTPQHTSKSCENHGGCHNCENNRKHSSLKREPIVLY